MTDYLDQCIEAAALARKGKTHIEVKEALGFRYAHEAQRSINIGFAHDRAAELALTPDEVRLLLAVASAERSNWAQGDTCAPKLKYLPLWPWRRGKIERIARKRLDIARKGEENLPAWQQTGLGLLNAYHGGFVKLRASGWAVVHVLEAKGGAA
jgi:hypothetical protein